MQPTRSGVSVRAAPIGAPIDGRSRDAPEAGGAAGSARRARLVVGAVGSGPDERSTAAIAASIAPLTDRTRQGEPSTRPPSRGGPKRFVRTESMTESDLVSRTKARLSGLYDEFVESVADHERTVGESRSSLGDVTIREHLRDRRCEWTDDAPATRALAGAVVVERLTGGPISADLGRTLIGLDLAIAALDDYIDTRTLSSERRLELAAAVVFPALLSFSNVGERDRGAVVDALVRYLVETARIPTIERRLPEGLPADTDDCDAVRRACASRARDITGFVTIPAATDRAVADSSPTAPGSSCWTISTTWPATAGTGWDRDAGAVAPADAR